MANQYRRIIAYIIWAGCAVIIIHMVFASTAETFTERLVNFLSHWVFVIIGISASVEIYELEEVEG